MEWMVIFAALFLLAVLYQQVRIIAVEMQRRRADLVDLMLNLGPMLGRLSDDVHNAEQSLSVLVDEAQRLGIDLVGQNVHGQSHIRVRAERDD